MFTFPFPQSVEVLSSNKTKTKTKNKPKNKHLKNKFCSLNTAELNIQFNPQGLKNESKVLFKKYVEPFITLLLKMQIKVSYEGNKEKEPESFIDFQIACNDWDSMKEYPHFGMCEKYELSIDSSKIILTASKIHGIVNGFITIIDMLSQSNGKPIKSCKIVDFPANPWRGVLVDPCRHFIKPKRIFEIISGLYLLKINVLHLHLTDDQAIRVESKVFPKLNTYEKNTDYYTHEEIKEIVEFARFRNIRVIPEIDLPGHSCYFCFCYPKLSSGIIPKEKEMKFGIFDCVVNPISEFSYNFFCKYFEEICSLFPEQYVHIGGDEVQFNWNENEKIREFKDERNFTDFKLLLYFFRNIQNLKPLQSKKFVFWDELLMTKTFTEDLDIENAKVIVQKWRKRIRGNSNIPVINSSGWYLDHLSSCASLYNVDLNARSKGFKKTYGGEACLWTELISNETILNRMFPFLAVVSHKLWNDSSTSRKRYTKDEDLYIGIENFIQKLRQLGIECSIAPEQRKFLLSKYGSSFSKVEVEKIISMLNFTEACWGGFNKKHCRSTLNVSLDDPLSLVDLLQVESFESRKFYDVCYKFATNRITKEALKIELGKIKEFTKIEDFGNSTNIQTITEVIRYLIQVCHLIIENDRCVNLKWISSTRKKINEREIEMILDLGIYIPLTCSVQLLLKWKKNKIIGRNTKKHKLAKLSKIMKTVNKIKP